MQESTLRITFDSNVWRNVVSPYDFPKDPIRDIYFELNKYCKSGKIVGCLSESIFNLEGIVLRDRKQIIGNDRGKIQRLAPQLKDGLVASGFSFGPDLETHPGSPYYFKKHLSAARLANFKVLYCPRLGGIKNRDLLESDYLGFSENISKIFSDVVMEIESWGCGQAQIRDIGYSYSKSWLDGLKLAPQSEWKRIAKAVAEWADADSVAAHIAYGNNFFCTYDKGKSAGANSVFSEKNIDRLICKYGFFIKTPEEL